MELLRRGESSDDIRVTTVDESPIRLAVIIVTYNSDEVLPALLDTLPSGLEGIDDYEVIVVDNNSHDTSVEIARTHSVGARVIQTGRNAGYAAGINAATATIGGDADILILNPDIRLDQGCVRQMYGAFGDPAVGVVVPKILHSDGVVCKSIRREPSVGTSWAEALLGGMRASRLGIGEIVDEADLYADGGSIEWATGAILLISHKARRTVGDWDESFFLYSEEVDYFERVRAANLSIAYRAEAQVSHIGGDYLKSSFLTSLMTKNRIIYFRRHHNAVATTLFRMGIVVGALLRLPVGRRHRAILRSALGFQA